jgi:hypothetical protein
MFGITRHSVFAFLYGFFESVGFTIPVLYMLAVNFWAALAFTVAWFYIWTAVGVRYRFFSHAMIAYSIGAGVGFILIIGYYPQIVAAIAALPKWVF